MRDPIVIVGAGASGVHFAATALALGRKVRLLDAGLTGAEPAAPTLSLNGLKRELDDPVQYFLGEEYEALILPEDADEYYGFPPSKRFVFEEPDGRGLAADGFAPLRSFAAGGLAQAWTAGCYPFSDGELAAFPFGWESMEAAYGEVARRIGVSGDASDDLSAYFPRHDGLMPPLPLDAHTQDLLSAYARRSRRDGMAMGRARVATLSRDHDGRKACSQTGRCLWGCPTGALYTPALTLAALRRDPNFEYLGGVLAERFSFGSGARIDRIGVRPLHGGAAQDIEVGTLVLAAGALETSRIVLESLLQAGVRAELSGLMDNRQVLMPFVNLRRIGARWEAESYQYNQAAIGAPGETPFDYVHGLVTTLKTALIHPIVQSLPGLGARAALQTFRDLHGGLGLVNINFSDTRRSDNRVTLDVGRDGRARRLLVSYAPEPGEAARLRRTIGRFRRFLGSLGCVAPAPMTRLRPMGASVHYAGTLPMAAEGGDLTCDRAGRCRPFANLLIADGASFPALPAKNLTFTLMANATRIAREALSA